MRYEAHRLSLVLLVALAAQGCTAADWSSAAGPSEPKNGGGGCAPPSALGLDPAETWGASLELHGTEGYWRCDGSTYMTYVNGDRQNNLARWVFEVQQTGYYWLSASLPEREGIPAPAYRTSAARYVVTEADTGAVLDEVVVDQGQPSEGWVDVGAYFLDSTRDYAVELGDDTGETGELSIIVDAIQVTAVVVDGENRCGGASDPAGCCAAVDGLGLGSDGIDLCGSPCAWYACTDACRLAGTPEETVCATDQGTCPVIDLEHPSADGASMLLEQSGGCFTATSPSEDVRAEAAGAGCGEVGEWMAIDGVGHGGASLVHYTLPDFAECAESPEYHSVGRWSLRFARPGLYRIDVYIPAHEGVVPPISLPNNPTPPPTVTQAEYVTSFRFGTLTTYIDQSRFREEQPGQGNWATLGCLGGRCWSDDDGGICFDAGESSVELRDYNPGLWHYDAYGRARSGEGMMIWFDAIRVSRVGDC